ncbi:MAG: hypothetical protein ACRDZW_09245, partial [Acidimicrobiales bacterium]
MADAQVLELAVRSCAGAPAAGADDTMRAAAARAIATRATALAQGDSLGPRPAYDAQAAAEARLADEQARQTRADQAGLVRRATRLLMAANAAGLGLVAYRAGHGAGDGLVLLAGAIPLAALVLLTARMVLGARRTRAADRHRAEALQRHGVATLVGLATRQARAETWIRRAEALAEA